MAKVRERVEAEFENIERVIAELPNSSLLPSLSSLELAGVATLIHNFYNGWNRECPQADCNYLRKRTAGR